MRRYEKEYFERFDQASVEEHQKYGALLEQEIAASYLKRSDKEALTDRIKAYRQDFAAVAETIQKVNVLTGEYKEKSARAKELLEEFGNALPQQSAGETGGYLIGVLVVLGFLIIVALGSFFARAMYEPIKKLAQYMESLAAGNVQEEVPFKDCAGEVGKMAASVVVFKDTLMRQELLKQQQEAINQDRAEYEQEAAAYIDKIVEEAEGLSTCGQELRSKAYEAMNISLSVSDEMADTNSLMLRLAEKVDAIDSALYQINGSQSMEVVDRIKKQLKEIREGMNKAVSKILLINDVILKVKGLSKEMVVSAEGQGPATRGVVRGIRYVSSIAHERMTGNGRS
jgi:methyl-accepting chemotaxis protein